MWFQKKKLEKFSVNVFRTPPKEEFLKILESRFGLKLEARENQTRTQRIYDRDEPGVFSDMSFQYELWKLKGSAGAIEIRVFPTTNCELDLTGNSKEDALGMKIWRAFNHLHMFIKAEPPAGSDVRKLLGELTQKSDLKNFSWSKMDERETVFFLHGVRTDRVKVDLTGAQSSDLGNEIRIYIQVPLEFFPEPMDPREVMGRDISLPRRLEVAGLSELPEFLSKLTKSEAELTY